MYLGRDSDTSELITSCVVTASDILTQTEEKAEQERQTMLAILVANKQMNTDKWKKACADKGVSRNAFYTHKDYLVQTQRVHQEQQGTGKPTFYRLPIPPIPDPIE